MLTSFFALPEHSLMVSVYTDSKVTRKNILARLVCTHPVMTTYQLIDHNAGPGSFADNYDGKVCVECGKILSSFLTN